MSAGFDVHVGATLLAAGDHLGLGRELGEFDVDVDDLAVPPLSFTSKALRRPMMMPGSRRSRRRRSSRVPQRSTLGDELATVNLDLGDFHGHAGAEAGGQAGTDLEAEQAAAEQGVGVTVVPDDLRPSRRRSAAARPSGTSFAR